MTKNLGKQTILFESFLNGVLSNSMEIRQTVYEKKDGTLEVNHLGGRREITRKANGKFYWRFDVRSIKTHKAENLFKSLQGK